MYRMQRWNGLYRYIITFIFSHAFGVWGLLVLTVILDPLHKHTTYKQPTLITSLRAFK